MQVRHDGPAARSKTPLLLAALGLAVVLTAVGVSAGGSESGREIVEQMLGDRSHGPLHPVAERLVGGRQWQAFAYLDADGRPCFVETLGGGGCHAHAGRVSGQIADYGWSGASWETEDGSRAEYVVVTGAVPPGVHSVSVVFGDGTAERVQTHGLPGVDDRVFALLSEGDVDRTVVAVRSAD